MELLIILALPILAVCLSLLAIKGTRIRREKEIPIHLIGAANSIMDMTDTERVWGLK